MPTIGILPWKKCVIPSTTQSAFPCLDGEHNRYEPGGPKPEEDHALRRRGDLGRRECREADGFQRRQSDQRGRTPEKVAAGFHEWIEGEGKRLKSPVGKMDSIHPTSPEIDGFWTTNCSLFEPSHWEGAVFSIGAGADSTGSF